MCLRYIVHIHICTRSNVNNSGTSIKENPNELVRIQLLCNIGSPNRKHKSVYVFIGEKLEFILYLDNERDGTDIFEHANEGEKRKEKKKKGHRSCNPKNKTTH